MDHDLVVLIQAEDHDKHVVFIEKTQESLAALVSLIPSFKLDEQKVELIFLVDRSGSMMGASIEQAKKALELFLHSIPSNCNMFGSITSGLSSLFGNSAKNQEQMLSSNSFDTNIVKQQEDDNLTKLINLQMANGSFKFGTVIQDLIGTTERQIIEKFHETEVDVVWITALALALLEKKFTDEKELWELIANKAKIFIQTNAMTNFDDIMTKSKAFLA